MKLTLSGVHCALISGANLPGAVVPATLSTAGIFDSLVYIQSTLQHTLVQIRSSLAIHEQSQTLQARTPVHVLCVVD